MSKKYKLHRITKKEAKAISEQCDISRATVEDGYCLVNKKGKILSGKNGALIVRVNEQGRTEAETNFLNASLASSFFKGYAEKEDIVFKIPKAEDMLNGNLSKKKASLPEKEDEVFVGGIGNKDGFDEYKELVEAAFATFSDLRDEIPTISFDIQHEDEAERDDDFDDYDLSDFDDDEYDDDKYDDEDEEYEDEYEDEDDEYGYEEDEEEDEYEY